MMVNEVLTAITTRLGDVLGDAYHYYTEDVEQSLSTPAFTVDALQPFYRSKSPLLYDVTVPVVIHFYPSDSADCKEVCYTTAEETMACLEYLPFQDTTLRAENMRWLIVDEVVEMFLTYRFTTMRITDAIDDMEFISESNITHAN